MRFYRRDLVLLAASILFTMAAAVYMGPYAFGVGAGLFFGIKMIAVRRQDAVDKEVGEGLCAECGQRITGGRCPSCDAAGGPGAGGPGAGGPGGGYPVRPVHGQPPLRAGAGGRV